MSAPVDTPESVRNLERQQAKFARAFRSRAEASGFLSTQREYEDVAAVCDITAAALRRYAAALPVVEADTNHAHRHDMDGAMDRPSAALARLPEEPR